MIGASLVFAVASFGAAACSDDHGDDGHNHGGGHLDYCDLPKACQEIIDACHPKDLGEGGEIGDCHEVAHEGGDEAECEAALDDCVQVCNDAPLPPNAAPYTPEECGDGGHSHDHE